MYLKETKDRLFDVIKLCSSSKVFGTPKKKVELAEVILEEMVAHGE